MINQQVVLKHPVTQSIAVTDFGIVEQELNCELEQGQVLLKSTFLSLDPYMRSQIAGRYMGLSVAVGEVLPGECVAQVIDSKNPSFKTGQQVRAPMGWQQYAVLPAESLTLSRYQAHPELELSVLGMPAFTAYCGLFIKAKLQGNETVVVPAVTGAVGSMVAQYAKLKGCMVIGITSSNSKCQLAVDKLNVDVCLNRKDSDFYQQLVDATEKGIDLYFDLVGGELLNQISQNLAVGAQVILCGLMADIESPQLSSGPSPALWIRARASVYGLVVFDHMAHYQAFYQYTVKLLQDNQLQIINHINQGLNSAPQAFCDMLAGNNHGKTLVQL